MKKFKNVLNDLPGFKKVSLPKKNTMNRREGTITSLKSSIKLTLGARKGLSLTLPLDKEGANNEIQPIKTYV